MEKQTELVAKKKLNRHAADNNKQANTVKRKKERKKERANEQNHTMDERRIALAVAFVSNAVPSRLHYYCIVYVYKVAWAGLTFSLPLYRETI